jgi:hypothetical protein
MKSLPKIVITKLPRWNYFQYFILGFFKLREKNIIDFEFKTDYITRLSRHTDNRYILGASRKFIKDSYNLEGYIAVNNTKKYFCIDSADAPFLFDSECLEKVSVYFKIQCPVSFDEKGFPLTNKIYIPYCGHKHIDSKLKLTDRGERKPCDNLFQNIHKIKPLMVGPRKLARGNRFQSLNERYEYYVSASSVNSNKKLMCYFGNALGPVPSINVIKPDFDWESDIMAWFQGSLNHPNEKRDKAAALIGALGKDYDARIINPAHADTKGVKAREDLIVPLDTFCHHIAGFQYNLNISGYRMSIPNRFIESFMAGTAIFTDALKVRWYLPFDEEVVETTEMGYLPDEDVDWNKFTNDLRSLPEITKNKVLSCFYKKWEPETAARYIAETLINAL